MSKTNRKCKNGFSFTVFLVPMTKKWIDSLEQGRAYGTPWQICKEPLTAYLTSYYLTN